MKTTLGNVLIEAAQAFPDRIAVSSPEGELSYSELSERAGRVAATLIGEGLADGRIGILLPNLPIFPIILHGAFRAGASALLLNPANSVRETTEQIADGAVDVVITIEALRPLVPPTSTLVLVDDADGSMRIVRSGSERTVAFAAEPMLDGGAVAPDDEAVVIFTAAMTGRARGAVLTHGNLVANLRATARALDLQSSDRIYAALPFAHAFGFTVCLNAALSVGATVLPVARFNPVAALETFERTQATVLCGVPAMYLAMLGAAARKGAPRHALRVVLCGGAPLANEVARSWEDLFGTPLRQGYGLTEAAPVCLFNRVDEPNRIGTLGGPLPGVEISIRDAAGRELAEGEVGELCVKGENVFAGYLGEVPGSGPFVDGWLRTGDLADQRGGIVRFRGTLKRMFTRNGFNVYPDEVRRTLVEHEAIADAVVYGRPDPIRENEVILEVVPGSRHTLTEEDVRAICASRLAAYKQPSVIRVRDAVEDRTE